MTFIRLKAHKHSILSVLTLFIFSIILTFNGNVLGQDIDQAKWDAGKKLFKSQCQSCHLPDKKMTGPALQGALGRWIENGDYNGKSGEEWVHEWVKNNSAVLEAGHPYANSIYNEYGKSVMSLFPQLSTEDIDNIFYYADNFDKNAPATATAVVGADGAQGTGYVFPLKNFIFLLVLGLALIALILWRLFETLKRLKAQKEGKVLEAEVPFWRSKKLATVLVLAGVVWLSYVTASGAISFGRQQNYQPTQPIKYSHALHAGKFQIDCQYCHTGAAEGKHSNIPSVNVCMNCHKNIKQGPTYGRKEIAKIYAAIGFNPNDGVFYGDNKDAKKAKEDLLAYLKQDYDGAEVNQDELDASLNAAMDMFDKPVEWVRVHNLPDHVYFNHAQHVVAGKVECQTCHGNIQEMEVVAQHAPLSMGWCINCHRETEVDMGNNYYQVYEKFHEDLKSGKMDKVTVEDIGGTECQKCHY
ncbi:MAG: c-type cytochrome [Chitinophagales bacterium]|nr:cytochrome c class I [Bacteroidota bacterium]MCB9226554.1 cytochrome c class I [Chitinophagales bacterium]